MKMDRKKVDVKMLWLAQAFTGGSRIPDNSKLQRWVWYYKTVDKMREMEGETLTFFIMGLNSFTVTSIVIMRFI